jgi:hypothetical protein
VRPRLGKALGGVKDVRHRARSGMGDVLQGWGQHQGMCWAWSRMGNARWG